MQNALLLQLYVCILFACLHVMIKPNLTVSESDRFDPWTSARIIVVVVVVTSCLSFERSTANMQVTVTRTARVWILVVVSNSHYSLPEIW